MYESLHALMELFPEAIVQVAGGLVKGVNSAARRYLPHLEEGAPVPDFLELICASRSGNGTFTQGPCSYTFSTLRTQEEQLILFRPAPQRILTDRQLDRTLYQFRELLSELLGAAARGGNDGDSPAFSRTFHRMFRLVSNLEYMQEASVQSVPFCPIPVDLDNLCRELASELYGLLRHVDVTFEYECPDRGLFIPGDPQLIRRLLLDLISNAARAASGGRVILSLRRQQSRALLTLSDTGPLLDQRQLSALLQDGGGSDIPLPGQGAGLGLPIVRHIVSLHRGEMLFDLGQSTPVVMISLPTGPLDRQLSVHTPSPPQRDGGLSPLMVELSDVLPSELFSLQELD